MRGGGHRGSPGLLVRLSGASSLRRLEISESSSCHKRALGGSRCQTGRCGGGSRDTPHVRFPSWVGADRESMGGGSGHTHRRGATPSTSSQNFRGNLRPTSSPLLLRCCCCCCRPRGSGWSGTSATPSELSGAADFGTPDPRPSTGVASAACSARAGEQPANAIPGAGEAGTATDLSLAGPTPRRPSGETPTCPGDGTGNRCFHGNQSSDPRSGKLRGRAGAGGGGSLAPAGVLGSFSAHLPRRPSLANNGGGGNPPLPHSMLCVRSRWLRRGRAPPRLPPAGYSRLSRARAGEADPGRAGGRGVLPRVPRAPLRQGLGA